jgi:hypothetical protein
VIQVVDGHAQLARSHRCCMMTRILEWYGMLKWNEKSSPMTNGIRAILNVEIVEVSLHHQHPFHQRSQWGHVDEDINNSSGGECKDLA